MHLTQVFPIVARALAVDVTEKIGEIDPLGAGWPQLVDVITAEIVERNLPIESHMPLLRCLDGLPLWSETWRPASVEPWTVRTRNVLRRAFATLPEGGRWADLSKLCPGDIMTFPNAGVKTRNDIVRMSVELSGWIASGRLSAGEPVRLVVPDGTSEAVDVVHVLAAVALPGLETVARWASVVLPGASLETAVFMARNAGAPEAVRAAANEMMSTPTTRLSGQATPPSELFERLKARFEDRDWTVLRRRRLVAPEQVSTLAEIAEELELSRERIRQLQIHVLERLEMLLASDEFVELSWRAERLRAEIGVMVAADSSTAKTAISDAVGGEQLDNDLKEFLLALAGPYRENGGWLERVALDDLEKHVLSLADGVGLLPEDLHAALGDLGVVEQAREAVLERCSRVRLVGGRFVAWRGSIVDKAVMLLTLRGAPATAEELLEEMGEDRNLSGLRDRLRSDPRTMRVDLSRFGLRSWGLEEYSGIVSEILDRIDRDGGRTSISGLVDELPRLFGVSVSSVRTYIGVPLFITEGDEVRIRESHERVVAEATLQRLARTFARNEHVSFVLEIDSDSERGSGRPIATGLSAALGVQPGVERRFTSESGEVRIRWPVGSQQPSIGSIKELCETLGVASGDRLRLCVDTGHGSFEVRIVDEEVVRDGTLEGVVDELVGVPREPGESAEALLCSLMRCPRTSLDGVLSQRRDVELVAALRRAVRPLDGVDDVADLLRILGA